MMSRPTTIKHTSRQRVTSRNGVELERQSIYMPAAAWESLQRLCYAQGRSGSLVLQDLIRIADLGTHSKDINNDKQHSTSRK
jgi:hypothetical protein